MTPRAPVSDRERVTDPLALLVARILVVLAALAAWRLLPTWPQEGLDEPAYWGVFGYLLAAMLMLAAEAVGRDVLDRQLRIGFVFLAALPLVYLAGWLSRGAGWFTGLIEIPGALLFWAGAWVSARVSVRILPLAIAAHALWDGAHYTTLRVMPDWYVVTCLLADLSIAFLLSVRLGEPEYGPLFHGGRVSRDPRRSAPRDVPGG